MFPGLSHWLAGKYVKLLLTFLNISLKNNVVADVMDEDISDNNVEDSGDNDFEGDTTFPDVRMPMDCRISSYLPESKVYEPTHTFDTSKFVEKLLQYRTVVDKNRNDVVGLTITANKAMNPNIEKVDDEMFRNADRAFWEEWKAVIPLLSFIDDLFLNIPATSISVEKLFSVCSLMKSAKKNFNV